VEHWGLRTSSHLLVGILGLGAASSWGAGDFAGGMAARRWRVTLVAAASQALGAALYFAVAAGIHDPWPGRQTAIWSIAAGVMNCVGIVALYRALAIGTMSVAAPVAALLTAAVPVAFAAATRGLPPARQLAGFALAAIAIALVTRGVETASGSAIGTGLSSPESLLRRSHLRWTPALRLAMISGLGFGFYLVFLHAAHAPDVLWPVIISRASAALSAGIVLALWSGVFAALPVTDPQRVRLRDATPWATVALTGVLDASGTALFLAAARYGRMDVAAVVASLYPAATVVLARLLLHERLRRAQAAGVVFALMAVMLLAS
jgi:drug/metabolite transporter (DMT)-like permease